MPTNAWKEAERQTASYFGCRRNPGSGAYDHHSSSDTLSKRLFIEIKQRASMAIWTLYRSVRIKAAKERKVPVIASHVNHTSGFLITVHSKDLPAFISDYVALYGFNLPASAITPIKDDEHRHPRPA